MVGQVAGLQLHVDGAAGVGDHGLEEVAGLAGVEAAELARGGVDLDVPDQIRAAGQVDRGPALASSRGTTASPKRRTRLVAESLGEGLPEGDAGVLDGVVGVDLQIALGLHAQVEAGVPAQLGDHVVEERHPGVGPAVAAAVQVELHGDLDLGGAPLDPGRPRGPSWDRRAHGLSSSVRAARKASSSAGVPIVTLRYRPRVGYRDTSRTRTPVEQALPEPARVERGLEAEEVGVAGQDPDPGQAEGRGHPLALPLGGHDVGHQRALVLKGAQADRLGEGGQVVGQPDQPDPVDHGRVGEQVAEPQPGHAERLGEGAGDDQVGVARQQLGRVRGAELAVGLVDHDQAGAAAQTAASTSVLVASPVGLLGEHQKVRSAAASATRSAAAAASSSWSRGWTLVSRVVPLVLASSECMA